MFRIQLLAIIASLGFLAYIGRLIIKGQLREEYSIVWFFSTLVLIVFAFWRNGLEVVSHIVGIIAAPNMVFTGAIFLILVYLLHLSIVMSRVQKQNKEFSQEIGLLKQQLTGKKNEVKIAELQHILDTEFKVLELDSDPAFSKYIPMVYELNTSGYPYAVNFDWKNFFEPDFCKRFNGLMIKGDNEVGKINCISFPAADLMAEILETANAGDVIFSHHPLDMRCGDPKGQQGEGFLPGKRSILRSIKEKKVSFYALHAPLDYHPEISTPHAIANMLQPLSMEIDDTYYHYGNGNTGVVGEILPIKLSALQDFLLRETGLPYLDIAGNMVDSTISRIAIVAGSGGNVQDWKEAEAQDVDCLIQGEVTNKIFGKRGDAERVRLSNYYKVTGIAGIGLSHAYSEFIVMKEMVRYFEGLELTAEAIPENKWWR